MDGNVGHDLVDGGADNDTLWGSDGNDTLHGQAGDDIPIVGVADQQIEPAAYRHDLRAVRADDLAWERNEDLVRLTRRRGRPTEIDVEIGTSLGGRRCARRGDLGRLRGRP